MLIILKEPIEIVPILTVNFADPSPQNKQKKPYQVYTPSKFHYNSIHSKRQNSTISGRVKCNRSGLKLWELVIHKYILLIELNVYIPSLALS